MRRHRPVLIGLVLVLVASLATYVLYRLERRRQVEVSHPEVTALDSAEVDQAEGTKKVTVDLYLYRPDAAGPDSHSLVKQSEEIPETTSATKEAQQIVTAVIKDSLEILPPTARVRQVYLLEGGTAVVDLSRETSEQLVGGVTSELGILHSITRSLRANLSQIARVRFLVNGQEAQTFAGHVSIHNPFM
ncbi:MAG: GerMN domain-containing protein [Acidobacteriota bacterium]